MTKDRSAANEALRRGISVADIEAEREMAELAAQASRQDLAFAQVIPAGEQIVAVRDFATEAEEDQRIFELYHRIVAVAAVQGSLSDVAMASMVTVPSTGRFITVERFNDIFGGYLEHAAQVTHVKVAARLLETAMSSEKGDGVRARIAWLERKGGWVKKSEQKVEVSVEAKIEIQQKIEETRKNAFTLLDQLTSAKRTIPLEGKSSGGGAIEHIEEATILPMVSKFRGKEPEVTRDLVGS